MYLISQASLTLTLAVILVSSSAVAQTVALVPGISDDKIEQLCDTVSEVILSHKGVAWSNDNDGNGLSIPIGMGMYGHEVIFADAAGVLERDTPEIAKSKIQRFWLANRDRLSCSLLGFKVRNGNIVKLAIERNSNPVINDFIRRWNLDLNFVDKADGRTVLDYVDDEIAEARGTTLEPILQRHRALIVRFGAKHSSELR